MTLGLLAVGILPMQVFATIMIGPRINANSQLLHMVYFSPAEENNIHY
jgi:hypothetical protein